MRASPPAIRCTSSAASAIVRVWNSARGGRVGRPGARLGEHAGAVRQRVPRRQLVRGGRLDAGPQLLRQAAVGAGQDRRQRCVQRVEGVQRRAAVEAGVHGPLAGADLQAREHRPARPDRQRGRVGIEHLGVEGDHAVGAALVRRHPAVDVVGAGLLRALDQHPHVDRQLAGVGHGARDVQQRQEVALVVAGAAGVQPAVADVGLERRRRPRRLVAGVLDVVVAVDQHGRRALVTRAQLADHQRRAAGRVHQIARPAGGQHPPLRPYGRLAQRGLVARAGRDRRDPQPLGRLVDQRVELVALI